MTSPRKALVAGSDGTTVVRLLLPPARHRRLDVGALTHWRRHNVDGKSGRSGSQKRENMLMGGAVGIYEYADVRDARRDLLEHVNQFGA